MAKITSGRRRLVWSMFESGYHIWEIANKTGLTEAQVVKILCLK